MLNKVILNTLRQELSDGGFCKNSRISPKINGLTCQAQRHFISLLSRLAKFNAVAMTKPKIYFSQRQRMFLQCTNG